MGQAELGALNSLLHGNFALVIGLVLTLCGLYQILVARNSSLGTIMIIVGLCLSFLPNIMGGVQSALCPIVQTLGGQCAAGLGAQVGGGTSNILQ